ncbi:LysR family transcriptional regulator [Loktanella agnita]|uniref:LysR family transcriptional regulator n=1 Tax=Loktanella agnita TaxID=287097 RepID=UPI003988C52B
MMDRPDIPLNALRTFEVAARQGSFTRAAVELRVTQAAVSHQVARLEDLLGVTLFTRSSGGLLLSEEGKALFPMLERCFDTIGRALDMVDGRRHVTVIRVGVVSTFALGWLMPRLPRFHDSHPHVDLRLFTNNNRVEIAREGLDIAIRFGKGPWPEHEAVQLMEAPITPLCTPALAAELRGPADLAGRTLLRSYRANEWKLWCAAAGVDCPALDGPVLDSSVAIAELATLGQGIALLPVAMFQRQIAAGQLVQPFQTLLPAGGYWLTYPTGRKLDAATGDFLHWIRQELG